MTTPPNSGPPAPRITRWTPPITSRLAQCPRAQIRITGQLTQDAEYRVTPYGHALLTVYVGQGPDAMPWKASQQVGPDPLELMAASAKAYQLKRGALVTRTKRLGRGGCQGMGQERPHAVGTG